MAKIKLSQTDILPKCPHCEKEVVELNKSYIDKFIGNSSIIYSCPNCHKIISITSSYGAA